MSITSINNKDIICLATRRIDDDLPTNVQHLMLRLAENHRILYVEPPIDSVFLARNRYIVIAFKDPRQTVFEGFYSVRKL